MSQETDIRREVSGEDTPQERRTYQAPVLTRVELAVDESIAASCKATGVCDDPGYLPFPFAGGS